MMFILNRIPVVQVLVAAVTMLAIKLLVPVGYIEWAWRLQLSVVLVVISVVLILIGGSAFIKAGTTVNPVYPEKSSALVMNGVYGFSRNPMYLGALLLLLAWGLFLGSIPSFMMLPLFCWYITKTQIRYEEQALEKKFGDSYRVYKSKVRRWM